MRYGVALPNGGPDLSTLADLATAAEASGWDGVFVEDYIVYQGQWQTPAYDPWVLLAAMAGRTRQIRLGTMVTPLARRRPWKVAREAVTLDHLSGGRLILGAGAGDPADPTFERFGEETSARRRAQMLDEALEVLAGAWSGEAFTYTGRYFHVRDATLIPRPLQQPRIPIWIGGQWPRRGPAKRMLRWDGCCPYKTGPGEPWEDLRAEDVSAIRAAAGAFPRSRPFEISVGGRRRRPDWDAERAHIQTVAHFGATWWTEYVPPSDAATMRAAVELGPLRVPERY
ncbi:MAG TPA: LLM class flavin-dependent oxidoreductase [bacterium]|nr:LLM class flavin-dependent oxidoreductase [bacterium]